MLVEAVVAAPAPAAGPAPDLPHATRDEIDAYVTALGKAVA